MKNKRLDVFGALVPRDPVFALAKSKAGLLCSASSAICPSPTDQERPLSPCTFFPEKTKKGVPAAAGPKVLQFMGILCAYPTRNHGPQKTTPTVAGGHGFKGHRRKNFG